MTLRAKVKTTTGSTKHYLGSILEGRPVRTAELPIPTYVEIEETEEGFSLYYIGPNGECITDTWHQTLEDAMEQAKSEFEICHKDWDWKEELQ
jgi:hypothetical protein